MRLHPAAFVWSVAAAVFVGRLADAQSCCTTDSDCTDMMSVADIEYQSKFDKTLECDQNCPGLLNCNMFGLCEQCRGCFLSCEGALKFMEETSLSSDLIIFCSGIGITDYSDCEDGGIVSAGGSGSGSGSLSGDEGTASGSGSGSGMSSASGQGSAGYGSGAGAGSGSMSGSGSASGSGISTASDGAAEGYGSGHGSGSGSISSSSSVVTAEGSGEGSRIADIPGCDCGTAEIDPSFAEYFCTNGKSMYCDLECVDDPDPEDILLPEYGGLWCRPQGWNGCRMCKYDCSEYANGDCIPCPDGVKDWC